MVTIILIEPQTPGNIGSIARVMANFDFKDLILVNPECSIDGDSRRFAKNAQEILKNVKIRDFSVLKEFDLLAATTSRVGKEQNLKRVPMMSEEFAKKLSSVKDKKVAIVFGREDHGLNNDEIGLCDFIVTIPTSKKYDSMNISHSAAIILYDIKKQELTSQINEKYTPMSNNDKEQIIKMLCAAMENMDFVKDSKKRTQVTFWKMMITKSMLTSQDAKILMGFLKKIK